MHKGASQGALINIGASMYYVRVFLGCLEPPTPGLFYYKIAKFSDPCYALLH